MLISIESFSKAIRSWLKTSNYCGSVFPSDSSINLFSVERKSFHQHLANFFLQNFSTKVENNIFNVMIEKSDLDYFDIDGNLHKNEFEKVNFNLKRILVFLHMHFNKKAYYS